MTTCPLQNWIPYRLLRTGNDVRCRWLYIADRRFTAPFFDQTQQQCLSHAHNSGRFSVVSTLDGLIDLAPSVPAVAPTAFIFHVSRCGSTLLSQLLALREQRIVLSEVPLLDELLRLPEQMPSLPEATYGQAIRAAVHLLGQRRTGAETELIIKLDSWHVAFYPLLRQLYPDVPMVLLYRAPEAVLASHRRQRGRHAIPGLLPPAFFNLTATDLAGLDFDPYLARVLTYYFDQFLAIADRDDRAFLLAYRHDGPAMLQSLMQWLNRPLPEADWQAVRERSGFHAKRPEQAFWEARPADPLPDYLRPAHDAYERLEQKRQVQPVRVVSTSHADPTPGQPTPT